MKTFLVAGFLLCSCGIVLGKPQGYGAAAAASSGGAPANSGAAAYVAAGPSPSGNSGAAGGNAGGSPGPTGTSGASSGGPLQIECKKQESSPGNFKFVCEGVNKDSITLRSEHILWLQTDGGKQTVLDIEVPNYKIDELIKAGFKPAKGGSTQVNVLLKKPEQDYNAEVDVPKSPAGDAKVNLQYEPVQKISVHLPNDKPFRPLSGPILPPPNSY